MTTLRDDLSRLAERMESAPYGVFRDHGFEEWTGEMEEGARMAANVLLRFLEAHPESAPAPGTVEGSRKLPANSAPAPGEDGDLRERLTKAREALRELLDHCEEEVDGEQGEDTVCIMCGGGDPCAPDCPVGRARAALKSLEGA